MNIDDELRLSFYREIAELNPKHSAKLVQHIESHKLFVKKRLKLYDMKVYQYLKEHPVSNMPKIIELAQDADTLIVVEEYLAGDTLQEILDQCHVLPEKTAVEYLMQLCRIVSDLHSASIIHRDIKPSNIILSPDGVIKLLDINAAKFASAQKTRDTVLMGTAGYAAPEQYGFSSSNKQTDIYALGVLLNVLLTGELPQNKPYQGKFTSVIQGCIKLNWKERYTSAEEVLQALTAIQKGALARFRRRLSKTLALEKIPDSALLPEYRKYFPPGFRTNNYLIWPFAFFFYVFAFYIVFSITVTPPVSPAKDLFSRICVFAMLALVVLFSGNYLGVRDKLPLVSSKNFFIRIVSIAITDCAIMFSGCLFALVVDHFL